MANNPPSPRYPGPGQDLTCRCGSSNFLTFPRTNLSRSEPADACFDYRILDARGTAEPQGISMMFQTLVSRVLQNTTGCLSQPILYPAEYLSHAISTGIQACPDQKYVLLGYSQGASLVLQASSQLGKKALEAIKAIILVGNPYRIPGKSANVDSHGNTDARGNIGMFVTQAITSNTTIPQFPESLEKSGKVLDYCLENDIVCASDPACDCQIAADHLSYGLVDSVQETAFQHIVKVLA
ncbi:alpha/beta-hydrolase [Aureobasidium pullulans]|nr:alpha/beta-hydrolase [Aureobasidium pullulans]